MRKFLASHLPWLLIIVVITLFLSRNLWSTRATIETHDGIYHMVRQEVFSDAFKQGSFPVRWAGSLDNGFGLPLFNYIYPGPYYLGTPLSLLGISSKWVMKIVEMGLYLFGALGIYFLFAKHSKFFATATAIFYLSTPYLILNIFVRGALGEQMAIACMPWILLSLNDMAGKKKLLWYHPLPYFLMFIAHNFLSFLFVPIYVIVVYFKYRDSWFLVLKNFLLSLGLAAFFVLPMILEQGYLYSVAKGDFTYTYLDHFVYPIQLLRGVWGNGFSYPGVADGVSFALGYTSLFILGLGIFTTIRKRTLDLSFWLVLSALILFFLLPFSQPIWEIVKPLQMMQFPWRLLSFTILTIPIMGFYLMIYYKKIRFLPVIILLLLYVSLRQAYHYTINFYFQNDEQLLQQLYLSRTRTTTSSRLEILPKWGSADERYIGSENIRVQHSSADISDIHISSDKLVFTADSQDSSVVFRIRRNYFPSWAARDESGTSFVTRASEDGLVDFTGREGKHTYTVYVGSTMTENLANLISLTSIIICIYLVIKESKNK